MNLSDRKLKERKVRQELILNGALEVFKERVLRDLQWMKLL